MECQRGGSRLATNTKSSVFHEDHVNGVIEYNEMKCMCFTDRYGASSLLFTEGTDYQRTAAARDSNFLPRLFGFDPSRQTLICRSAPL